MEQWEERQQLLEAKLDEIRKKPGNSLTGASLKINKLFIQTLLQHPPAPPLKQHLH